ncbi:MAG: glutamine-hydrolyzing carbamoyl-phosphate synthase small subunit [Termitinemataceae bacterium]|nr:MAG: glutamine-hydrolyzing carbamoyl-phosphate synthase small subunit [Termitinemataceae bacterium]
MNDLAICLKLKPSFLFYGDNPQLSKRTNNMKKAKLILEDGTEYTGFSFGAAHSKAGELVFTTGMTGYPQSLTDPSFRGQILVSTYPLVGNYGVPLPKSGKASVDENGVPLHFESDRIQVSGFVVMENCEVPSHFSGSTTLSSWMQQNDVPAICGIDTRALTKKLRESGVMRSKIVVEDTADVAIDSGDIRHPVADVSCGEVKIYKPKTSNLKHNMRIVLVDCGAKANILRCLLERGVEVIRVPWDYDPLSAGAELKYDGLFLSNGPGDPKACGKTIAMLRRSFSADKPVFGICLGVQIMALAAGADTYKLPYGHRAQNQPCIELETQRCYITSQNHGYAVRSESLPRDWETWFVNANDGTCEGIKSKNKPFSAVQFHPEGCPGPRDTEFLIDRFLDQCRHK